MRLILDAPAAKEHEGESLYNHEEVGQYTFSTIALTEDKQYVPRKNAAKAPVNQFTWKGAVLFCKWSSAETGKQYRLPSEAELELAARGNELRKWPWGDDPPTAKHGSRYDYDAVAINSAELADRIRCHEPTWTTTSVGSYPANETHNGVRDMLGYIIGEWCANKWRMRIVIWMT